MNGQPVLDFRGDAKPIIWKFTLSKATGRATQSILVLVAAYIMLDYLPNEAIQHILELVCENVPLF